MIDGSNAISATWMDVGRRVDAGVDEKSAFRAFDTYFISEMLERAMPSKSESSGLFDGGNAGRMYREHFHQELARIVSESGQFGLSSALEGSMSGQAEQRSEGGEG